MITNFLIGAVIVAAGWALLAFGRDWAVHVIMLGARYLP